MNIQSAVALAIVGVAFLFALRYTLKHKGKCGTCDGCSGCSKCSSAKKACDKGNGEHGKGE